MHRSQLIRFRAHARAGRDRNNLSIRKPSRRTQEYSPKRAKEKRENDTDGKIHISKALEMHPERKTRTAKEINEAHVM